MADLSTIIGQMTAMKDAVRTLTGNGTFGVTGFQTEAPVATASNAKANSKATTAAPKPSASSTNTQADHRVRLAHLPGMSVSGYSGILAPLKETQGLLFPYTPTISVTQDVDYTAMQMTHSNTDYNSYTRTPNTSISITGKFSVQNQHEGKYAMAAIHFLRSVSKMHFGQSDQFAGLPPPILQLSGYGTYMFNKVRVIARSHSYSLEEGMDMVAVTVNGQKVYLPALFTLQVNLVTQPTARAMRQDFSMEKYRSGDLLKDGGWL